jgi:hypothetical protein
MKAFLKTFSIVIILAISMASCASTRWFDAGVDHAYSYLENKYKGGEIKIAKSEMNAQWYRTPLGFVDFLPIQRNDSLIVPYLINYSTLRDSTKHVGHKLFFPKLTAKKSIPSPAPLPHFILSNAIASNPLERKIYADNRIFEIKQYLRADLRKHLKASRKISRNYR